MEGLKIYKQSYNYIEKLKVYNTMSVLNIDYRELDNKSAAELRKAINKIDILREKNVGDFLKIDYVDIKDPEECKRIRDMINGVLNKRSRELFNIISSASSRGVL